MPASERPRGRAWKGLQVIGVLMLCWAVGSYVMNRHDPAAAWPFLFVLGGLLYAVGRLVYWWKYG